MKNLKKILSFAFLLLVLSLKTGFAKKVLVMEIKGPITPVTYEYFKEGYLKGKSLGVSGYLLVIDTPGGLLESTRKIVKIMLGSRIPFIAWVGPSGARAASAGTFILAASHIATMAPGTHLGAAHPITLFGKTDKTLKEKIQKDLIAWVKNIAHLRHRNSRFLIKAITKSETLTAREALKLGVINFIAKDTKEALKKAGFNHPELIYFKEGTRIKILKILTNPNIMYILLMLGLTGIYIELAHPGLIFPGVVGAISLILFLVGSSILPLNYAGLFLILLAFLLFFLETQIVSHGMLTLGGIVSLALGSLMLFNNLPEFQRVSYFTLLPLIFVFSSLAGLITYLVVKSLRKKPVSGKEGLFGKVGKVIEDFSEGKGKIFVEGEIWLAECEEKVSLKKGDEVIVLDKKGLVLKIKPVKKEK